MDYKEKKEMKMFETFVVSETRYFYIITHICKIILYMTLARIFINHKIKKRAYALMLQNNSENFIIISWSNLSTLIIYLNYFTITLPN